MITYKDLDKYAIEDIQKLNDIIEDLLGWVTLPDYIREYDEDCYIREYDEDCCYFDIVAEDKKWGNEGAQDLERLFSKIDYILEIYWKIYSKLEKFSSRIPLLIFKPETVTVKNLERFFNRSCRNTDYVSPHSYDEPLVSGTDAYDRYCKSRMVREIVKESLEFSSKETYILASTSNNRFLLTNTGYLIDLKEIYEKVRERWLKEEAYKNIGKLRLENIDKVAPWFKDYLKENF